jgi:1,2-diacylglycerol 3-alpha-glucosyltransferase
MKILLGCVTYHPDVNGAAYFSYRLATTLARRGHDVSVICPGRSFRDEAFVHNGVKVYAVRSVSILVYPDFRVSPSFLAKRSVRKIVKRIKPEIIHLQSHFMIAKAVADVARELGIPTLGTNHFMPENLVHYLHLPKVAEEKLKRFGWNQFLRVYKWLPVVTAPTVTAAKHTERAGLKKQVISISCGIDLTRFHPANDGAELKKRYGIPDGKILLYVGRLDKEKRIDVILHSLQKILQKTSAHLVLAGSGTQRQALESRAEALGVRDRVTFTGFVPDDDLPKLYTLAHIFVIAGIAELQSIVTMEAMASGLPILAAEVMALPELVHHEQNGYLFPKDDSESLAAAAIKLLTDEPLRQKMAQKSLDIIQPHDLRNVIKQYESLYERLIEEQALVLGVQLSRIGHQYEEEAETLASNKFSL